RIGSELQSLHGLCGYDFNTRHQQRRRPFVVDDRGSDLEPADLPLQAHHVDFIAFRCGLAGKAPAYVFVDELRIFGRHEVAEAAPDELHPVDTDKTGELTVGIKNDITMYDHRLVNPVAQLCKQFGSCARSVALT